MPLHYGPVGIGLQTRAFNPEVLQLRRVVLTPTDIKALNTTAYELVPSMGPDTYIEYLGGVIGLNFKSAAYASVANNLTVRYTDGSGTIVSTSLSGTGLLDASADVVKTLRPISTDYTMTVAKGLFLSIASANPTTGNSPVYFNVYYRVHSLGLADPA